MKRGMVALMVIGLALILGAWSWNFGGDTVEQEQTYSSESSGSTSSVAECCGEATSKAVRVYNSEDQFIGILLDVNPFTAEGNEREDCSILVYIPSHNSLAYFTCWGRVINPGDFFYLQAEPHYSNQDRYFRDRQTLYHTYPDTSCSLPETYYISRERVHTSDVGPMISTNERGCGGSTGSWTGYFWKGEIVSPDSFEFDWDGKFLDHLPYHYVYE